MKRTNGTINTISGTISSFSDRSVGRDPMRYEAVFAQLRRVAPFADATLATTLPRGGLQIVQPHKTDVTRLRAYGRGAHALDAVAWRAMALETPMTLARIKGRRLDSGFAAIAERFVEDFLRPAGLEHYVAFPLSSPVLQGYPGVLQVFRTAEEGPFGEDEIHALHAVAEQFDAAEASDRPHQSTHTPLRHWLPKAQIWIDADQQVLFPEGTADDLSEALHTNLLRLVNVELEQHRRVSIGSRSSSTGAGDARTSLGQPSPAGSNSDRLLVPDALGDAWTFRLSVFPHYPAITGQLEQDDSQPVACVSLQPEDQVWSSLQSTDFAADEEIARLVPALHFMQEHYGSNIALTEIASTVHLSPFHFHRRFTDLLGITPKHFLFNCQITEAKRRLVARDMDLREIATHCGFAHQSHFTSRFKQATGLTPTAWRRLAAQSNARTHSEA